MVLQPADMNPFSSNMVLGKLEEGSNPDQDLASCDFPQTSGRQPTNMPSFLGFIGGSGVPLKTRWTVCLTRGFEDRKGLSSGLTLGPSSRPQRGWPEALGAGVTFAIVFRTQLAWNRPNSGGGGEPGEFGQEVG